MSCRKTADLIGVPFIVSLPQSQLTYARLYDTADAYSRYSVDIFQPPQSDVIPHSPSSPDFHDFGTSATAAAATGPVFAKATMFGDGVDDDQSPTRRPTLTSGDTTTTGVTSTPAAPSDDAVEGGDDGGDGGVTSRRRRHRKVSASASSPADLCSLGGHDVTTAPHNTLTDGDASSPLTIDTATVNGVNNSHEPIESHINNTNGDVTVDNTASNDNQPTDSTTVTTSPNEVCNTATDDNQTTTTTTTASPGISNGDSSTGLKIDCSAAVTSTTNSAIMTPTRAVIGRQQEREVPAHLFKLKPTDKDGREALEVDYLPEGGRRGGGEEEEEVLDLRNVSFLALDWKNDDRYRPYVLVQTKIMDLLDDNSVSDSQLYESATTHLQQCIELNSAPEVLGPDEAWYCPSCKEHREATKQLSVWRLPTYLIIQLKRFSYRNFLWCDKVDKAIDFPIRGLDMRPYFVGSMPSGQPAPIYDLTGVVNHYGGILGGHYTAYARTPRTDDWKSDEIGWRHCDDSRVSNVSEDRVVTQAAYVLFYKRRDNRPVTTIPKHLAPAPTSATTTTEGVDNGVDDGDNLMDFNDFENGDGLNGHNASSNNGMGESDFACGDALFPIPTPVASAPTATTTTAPPATLAEQFSTDFSDLTRNERTLYSKSDILDCGEASRLLQQPPPLDGVDVVTKNVSATDSGISLGECGGGVGTFRVSSAAAVSNGYDVSETDMDSVD